MKKAFLVLWSVVLGYSLAAQPHIMHLPYPPTPVGNQIDDYFGTKVPDPYRWLEDDTAANTKAWVQAENKVTFNYLNQIPFRDKIKARLTELYNYERYGSPFRVGAYYFFSKNDGLQNQSVIYYQKGLNGEPKVFLDPNTLTKDGTAAVTLLGASHNHKYMAYSVSQSGSDWVTIYVINIETGQQLSDKLEWCKFTGAAWSNEGFYYSRYDKPASGKEFSNASEYQKIYYHKLGDAQDKDALTYMDKAHPKRYFGAQTTEDERFLIINCSEGTSGNELWYKDLFFGGQSDFKLLFKGFKYDYDVLNNVGDNLLVKTNDDALNNRVILVDPKNPEQKNWKNIVDEKSFKLESAGTAGGKLFVSYIKDVASHIYQYSFDGKMEKEIVLPGLGTASGISGNKDDKEVFYSFGSYNIPPSIIKYDIASGNNTVWHGSTIKGFDMDDYTMKQVFYAGKDGIKVPMYLVYKNGIKLDGSNPCFLYAYGGFNISITPGYNSTYAYLLQQGFVIAIPNIRGGGEYGESWHEAGMLLKKQTVFDDFISAAEYLIKEKYTSPARLCIHGRSNGGLLVGAVETQRPELFGVCLPGVGVQDMMRYHKFTVGWGWAVEYGSSDSAKYAKYLLGYSPLHNVRNHTNYPATLITTADHDDRVVPAHSFKFAATMQQYNKSDNPILIRIDVKAGHGAGKPVSKQIEEWTDVFAFTMYNLGLTAK